MPIGDGHDLQARRFSGDPVLEACYDGEHRMTIGENGPAVKTIQEALLLLQYPLPQWGADGKFGNETAAAVAQFKLDHQLAPADGVVGPKTMAELDRIFLLREQSPFTVIRLALMTDDYARPLLWQGDVIALSNWATTINLEVEGFGFLTDTPSVVTVQLVTRLPNQDAGPASIPTPLDVEVPLFDLAMGTDAPGRSLFRRSLTISEIGFPALTQAGKTKVVTIVRADEAPSHAGAATSDAHFRQGLSATSWIPLGRSIQPSALDPGTQQPQASGSAAAERPDALDLFRSGGNEVLEISSSGLTNKALLRNPANILYYSGHGLFHDNCLAIFVPTLDKYRCWAKATDIIPFWTAALRLHTLIIAGCSVLSINFAAPTTSPGTQWAKLTKAKGGPLQSLVGYGSRKADPVAEDLFAPKDDPVGNRIALEMGQRIAAGSTDLVNDWLTINANHRAWNAVAIDGHGFYWWIEKEAFGFSHTKHSQALP